MKLIRKTKKGFTLVELIVVIAIVAILAAVSVVSYVSFIGAANTSADQQAVTQMNRILMADSILHEDSTIFDLYKVLEDNGMSAKDYKPLMSDRYFFWDSTLNRVLYADKNNTVIYPLEYESVTSDQHQWYSLSNQVAKQEYTKTEETVGTVTYEVVDVTSAGQIEKLAEDIRYERNGFTNTVINNGLKAANNANIKLKIPSELDMMGSSFNIQGAVNCNILIEGAEGGSTIKGLVNANNFVEGVNAEKTLTKYGAGLLGYIMNSSVEVKNITLENSYIGSNGVDLVGVGLIGSLNASGSGKRSEALIENVTIQNCTFVGSHGIGSMIGKIYSTNNGTCEVTFAGTNLTQNNILQELETGYAIAGGAIGEITAYTSPSVASIFVNASSETLVASNNTITNDANEGAVYFAQRCADISNVNRINSLGEYNRFEFKQNTYESKTVNA